MEMRLEKNNCNLLRKTRNFYSVTPKLKLSDLDYLLKLKWGWGWGYSEALRAGLPVKFQQLKSQSAKISDNCHCWGGGYSATEKSKCQDF